MRNCGERRLDGISEGQFKAAFYSAVEWQEDKIEHLVT